MVEIKLRSLLPFLYISLGLESAKFCYESPCSLSIFLNSILEVIDSVLSPPYVTVFRKAASMLTVKAAF